MIDFHRVDYFSMTYIFMEEDADIACEYEQTKQPVSVTPDGLSVTFTLKNIDVREDNDEYLTTVFAEDDEFYIKSSYFEDADEPYPLSVEISDEEIKFTLAGEDEVMHLYGFFA